MTGAAEWESFYVLAGGAAAVVTGLIFLAVTLTPARSWMPRSILTGRGRVRRSSHDVLAHVAIPEGRDHSSRQVT
jgi:hypothetical protein